MAGTDVGFDAQAFRDGISFALTMAAAPEPARQVTFHFERTEQIGFDPAAAPEVTGREPVTVPCGIAYTDVDGSLTTGFGIMASSSIKLTLLDVHHAQVEGCAYVTIDGDTYFYRRTAPPTGLFDVGLFAMYFAARTET